MKKVLVLLIAFAIVGGVALFADPITKSDSLVVYGIIGAGDPTFTVTDSTTESTAIDLLHDDMDSTGDGREIGNWAFTAANSPATTYTIKYTFSKLEGKDSSNSSVEIDFVVSEDQDTWLANGGTTTYVAASGNHDESRTIYARLTAGGRATAEQAPNGKYQSTVYVELTSN